MSSRNKTERTVRSSRCNFVPRPFRRGRLLSLAFLILFFCAVGLVAVLCLELLDPEALDLESAEHAAVVARLAQTLEHFTRWK
jgi:hypothetical protein